MLDLGTLGGTVSVARGINNNGQIVGESYTVVGPAGEHAFLYSGGVMRDLNALVPSNSGWTLQEASAISNTGLIVGDGLNPNGQADAFLLTPVPEPAGVVLMAMGGVLGLGRCGRWRKVGRDNSWSNL
jgi:probable HAF family extracellular repeat protein